MDMEVGDTVAWHVMGWGSEEDFHPVHWHGQLFIQSINNRMHNGDVMEVRHILLIICTEIITDDCLSRLLPFPFVRILR
jgi:hypothetical protein